MYNLRTEKMSKVMKIYNSFAPILIKLESMILASNSGRSPQMTPYYKYWEEELYKSFIWMTLKNLDTWIIKLESKEVIFCLLLLNDYFNNFKIFDK